MVMKKFALLIAVLALFAGACSTETTIESGSDEDIATPNASDTTDTGADAEEAEPTTEPTTAPADATDETEPTAVPAVEPTVAPTAEPTEVPTAEPDDDQDGDQGGAAGARAEAVQAVLDADDWCTAAKAVEDSADLLDAADFTDPIAVEEGITQILAVITAAQRVAPAEIANDVEQVIAGFSTVASELEAVNWVFLDLDLSVIDVLDGPMSLSNYNIELYGFNECGIGTDPGPPPVILDDGTVEGEDTLGDDEDFQLEGTIREQVVASLIEAGFTESEATCITGEIDLANPAALEDPAAMLAIFSDCGIPLERLVELGS